MSSNCSYNPETLNSGQNWWFFCPMWPWNSTDDLEKKIGRHLFYATSSFVHHFVAIDQFKLELQSGNAKKIRVKIGDFFVPCDLEIWWITLKNNRAPLLYHNKLCASFHCHMWSQTGVTVRKRLSWILTSVTLTFDLDLLHGHHFWNWKALKVLWWYDDGNTVKKGVTDGQTNRRADGRTDGKDHRAAWSQLKNNFRYAKNVNVTFWSIMCIFNELRHPWSNFSELFTQRIFQPIFKKISKIFPELSRGQAWSYGWMNRRFSVV